MVERSEGVPFKMVSDFEPAGDQPNAVAALSEGIERGDRFQTLARHHRSAASRPPLRGRSSRCNGPRS